MKISIRELLENNNALSKIAARDLSTRASYAIAKNFGKVKSELRLYDKQRKKLIEKYAFRDGSGKIVSEPNGTVKFKDKDAWDKAINELMDIEVEIDVHEFSKAELENEHISPLEWIAIDFMLKKDKKEIEQTK